MSLENIGQGLEVNSLEQNNLRVGRNKTYLFGNGTLSCLALTFCLTRVRRSGGRRLSATFAALRLLALCLVRQGRGG